MFVLKLTSAAVAGVRRASAHLNSRDSFFCRGLDERNMRGFDASHIEVRAPQDRALQLRAKKIRKAQVRTTQVRALQVGAL